MKYITITSFVMLTCLCGSGYLYAVDQGMQNGQNKPKTGKPPQMAISVCTGKVAKSPCVFQGTRGSESGFCEDTPDKKFFACNPNRAVQGGNKRPTPIKPK